MLLEMLGLKVKSSHRSADYVDPAMVQFEEIINLEELNTDCSVCKDTGYVVQVFRDINCGPNVIKFHYERCECLCPVKPKVQERVDSMHEDMS